MAVAHEVGLTLIRGAGGVPGGLAEVGLMSGGVIGIWTACFMLGRIREIARERQREFLKECSRVAFSDWGNCRREGGDGGGIVDGGEEVELVVGWLGRLDELSGGKAGERLWDVVKGGSVRERRGLAKELGKWPVRSNVVVGVLRSLVRDRDESVRKGARRSLDEFQRVGILSPDKRRRSERFNLIEKSGGVAMSETPREYLNRLFVEDDSSSTTTIDVKLPSVDNSEEEEELGRRRAKSTIEIKAPILQSLRFPQMHTLCIAVGIPLVYEYYCLLTGFNDPLRFLGLGWVFAICGLAVYPRSQSAWKLIERACQDL